MQHVSATSPVKILAMKENGGEMTRVQQAAEKYNSTKADHEAARKELYAAIRGALAAGLPIGQVSHESGFDREHVRRIRDDRVEQATREEGE